MPDASSQMPETSRMANWKWQVANFGTALAIIKLARSRKLKLCDSLFLFFTVGKKEGGPTFNKLKDKGLYIPCDILSVILLLNRNGGV